MEPMPKPNSNSLNRYWRRRRYQKLDAATTSSSRKKNMKITRLKSSSGGLWRMKVVPKLRLKINIASPLQLWWKFKNAYIQMMNNWASKGGYLINDDNSFGGKRIPSVQKAAAVVYSSDEIEDRLVLEIYKALMATCKLSECYAKRVNI